MTRLGYSARVALVAGLLGLPGCLILDGRDELRIDPPGVLYADYRLHIAVDGSLDTFTLEIDGSPLDGVFPARQALDVPIPWPVRDGAHRLLVRAREGSLPRTAERTLMVERSPFTATVEPAPGKFTTGEPFAIAIAFSLPLGAVSVELGTQAGSLLVTPSVSPDGRMATFDLPASLDVLGRTTAYVFARSQGARAMTSFVFGPWYPGEVQMTSVTQPREGQATNGVLPFEATASGDIPPSAELLAGDLVIATLGPPPWSFSWDTTSTPEGTYQLSMRSRGYRFTGSFPSITVDRTPPRLVRCAPSFNSSLDDVSTSECLMLEFSEQVSGNATLVRAGQSCWPVSLSYVDGRVSPICPVPGCPTLDASALPAVQTVSLSVQDRAGNPLGPDSCPSMVLPAWRSPWGRGPIASAQGTLAASEIAVHGYRFDPWNQTPGHPVESAALLALPRAGGVAQVAIGLWSSVVPAPWSLERTLDAESYSTASDLGADAWVETVGLGPGHVYVLDGDPVGPLNRDPGRDARNPSAFRPYPTAEAAVAWSEELPSGGRAIVVSRQTVAAGPFYAAGGPALSYPTAVADEPSIGPSTYAGDLTVAWVEAAPGGVPQAQAAQGQYSGSGPDMAWWTVPGTGNVDPSQAAAEPSVATWAMVWREGGSVFARGLNPMGSGPAQLLNVDPTRPARSPRLDRSWGYSTTAYWVEESASGDAIWARRLDNGAWTLLPGPVNTGVPGAVRALDAYGGAVVWVDDVGAVHLRVANF